MSMKVIEHGVCASLGFKTGACHCGIRKNQSKDDLALIVSDVPCQVGAVYTKNLVKAAPLKVTKEHLSDGIAQAIIVNSGNANACNPTEMETAQREALCAAKYLGLDVQDVIVASTGVIGQDLPVACIENAVDSIELSDANNMKAAKAIMTTDTIEKSVAVAFEVNGKTVHMGGICKGSGMIHPNMGTMLAFITTDCKIGHELIQKALLENVDKTFNRVSVDGDTSTNDMCIVMANGLACNEEVMEDSPGYDAFTSALHFVMETLAKKIASDGEGAGKLMSVTVQNMDCEEHAEALSMSVCSSSLVKAAMFGADANWGRVICALGYSGIEFDTNLVDISFVSNDMSILCCKDGKGLAFDEDLAKTILSGDEVEIICDMKMGNADCTCWGCDLTYDYVKINGDYRT